MLRINCPIESRTLRHIKRKLEFSNLEVSIFLKKNLFLCEIKTKIGIVVNSNSNSYNVFLKSFLEAKKIENRISQIENLRNGDFITLRKTTNCFSCCGGTYNLYAGTQLKFSHFYATNLIVATCGERDYLINIKDLI